MSASDASPRLPERVEEALSRVLDCAGTFEERVQPEQLAADAATLRTALTYRSADAGNRRADAHDRLVEAARLKRNTDAANIGPTYPHGEWVAIPREDFDALRAAIRECEEVERLRAELEKCKAFERSVDEALNFGDGSYRP